MEKHRREETQKRPLKNDLYQLIVVLPQTNDNIILNTDELIILLYVNDNWNEKLSNALINY